MKTIILFASIATVLSLAIPSAHAIPRTFVSGTGAGATCTRAAPCATFQAAHDATDTGGEINCIDAGSFGGVTIVKSITIDCAGTLGALTGTGVTIDTAAVVVRLRNLAISEPVFFQNGAALFVENCSFTGTPGVGLSFFPPTGVTARLFVSDSVFADLGGNAISVRAGGTGSARATLDGVRIERSTVNGVLANGQAGTGLVVVHVRNSVLAKNASNIVAATTAPGQSIVSVTVDRTSATLGSNFGIAAMGPSSFILLGRSTAMSNTTGVSAANGATIFSYGNNHLSGNVTDGAPTAALALR
jgi:hypothetical protein